MAENKTLSVTVQDEGLEPNLQTFQRLLAYFVEHLELCNLYDQKCKDNPILTELGKRRQNELAKDEKEKINEAKEECWKNAKESMGFNFTHEGKTGQGYNDNIIQDGIKDFCVLKDGKVCISVQYGQKSTPHYISEASYLHWTGLADSVSIYAEADDEHKHVKSLYIKNKWNATLNNSKFDLAKLGIPIEIDGNNIFTGVNTNSNNVEDNLKNFYDAFVYAAKLATKAVLENAKNIIFTGAPGTGKTHSAKKIAKLIGAQSEFVQFHPSYDYTDFVEGLRPVKDANNPNNIVFERKDGIFKAFCERALKQWLLDLFVFVQQDKDLDNSKQTIEAMKKAENKSKKADENDKKAIVNLIEKLKEKASDNPAIKELLKRLEEKDKNTISTPQNFVFIIDEINRGEISKIFGELFFSADPGYRGIDGAVKTQYANLQTTPNLFDLVLLALGKIDDGDWGHFFIPENVYIIGTMNDIDRSVESMDFAFRRRFTFREIKAKDTQLQILSDITDKKIRDALVATMDNLNNAISAYEEFSDAYHIGGAYFRHYIDYANYEKPYNELWYKHIVGVLNEYLRGRPNAKEIMKKWKSAFDNNKTSEENAQE